VTVLRPLPRPLGRVLSLGTIGVWLVTMGLLVNRACVQPSPGNLAADLARYGSTAQWRGVYYRGEKIGFTVSQTVPSGEGFELQEDGRLQMGLLGATAAARLRTTARVDAAFALQSFEFSLDAGTGPVEVRGTLDGRQLRLAVTTGGQTRTEVRDLAEPPVLGVNLARRLASAGLRPGAQYEWSMFDPATLANAPMRITVGQRENVSVDEPGVVRAGRRTLRGLARRAIPAFRVDIAFAGLQTTSWVTDTGEVIREESPMGMIAIRESPERARATAVASSGRTDLLEQAAVKPEMKGRIDEPRNVTRLRLRVEGADLSAAGVAGLNQSVAGDVIELRDPRDLRPAAADPDAARELGPAPFLESDDPEVVAEARRAVAGVTGARERAERLTRHVNALLEKKPTVSLPSAREVLRTKVGDCNEHTVLYVALARAVGIPARIAVGLTFVRGAFYYHAWPEVYLDEGKGRGLWLPVDPTLNQFPADATHLRLARGGLDRQAAILPLIGRLKIAVLEMDVTPGSVPVLVGRSPTDDSPISIALPVRRPGDCWSEVIR
jgi:transglutaminase-like putative cysteine protease